LEKTFFSADDEPVSLPVHYTVTATGDPRKYMKRGKKRLVPILEVSVVTAEMGNNEFEPHETEVKEVRGLFNSTKKHLETAALGEDVGTEQATGSTAPTGSHQRL
jgi:hypothetical protein